MTSRVIRTIPLGRLRLAQVEDSQMIIKLLTKSMSLNFRVKEACDIVNLIENSVLSICQLDIHDTIIGFLAAKDYPLVPGVFPGAWEDFVWNKYKAVDLNARNTLFLHLLCWEQCYTRDVVDSMLKSLFMHDPYLQYIGIIKCIIDSPLLIPGQGRAEASFKRIQALERGVSGDQLPSLWVAERKEVSPRLRVRRAVEEDNDDIVPIIERHSGRLRELYGDFYINELVSRHPDSGRVLLVCEHKEVAVGVMCLNTQVNYEALEESFELSPFAGLRHVQCSTSHYKLVDSNTSFFGSAITESQFGSSADVPLISRETKPRVTWRFEDDTFKQFSHVDTAAQTSVSSSQMDILSLLGDDDDEPEFDIVNIDTDLLRLPRLYLNEDIKKDGLAQEKSYSQIHKDDSVDLKHLMDKKKKRSISGQYRLPEPARYSGSPNAFLLELFAMHKDYDERYGFDMLEVAFETFPDRDYCIVSLPSSHTCFPLLEHFTLVTPLSSRWRLVKESLFVAHVNCIKGNVKIRPGEAYDKDNLTEVLEHSPRKHDLIALFMQSLQSSTLSSFVLLNENNAVGVVILAPLEDAMTIRNEFDLEPEMREPNGDASILAGVISPVMEPHARWYLREIMRHSEYSTLFWICRLFSKGDASPIKNMTSLAAQMLPVRPRPYLPPMVGNKELEKVYREVATPFALWSIEPQLTSLPKVSVNTSIVVVGASRTGLAFLETLILGPSAAYLTFTNVTLVSEFGLPASESLRGSDTCVPRSARYTDRYLKSLPFYYYIDVITGLMVKIDREQKCIYLHGGGVKFYDELVLTCGRQFQDPHYLKESLELAKEVKEGKQCERILMDDPKYKPEQVPPPPEPYENVMMINSQSEGSACVVKLLYMISEAKDTINCVDKDNPVVVYGDCIEAYCCIAALLEQGVDAQYILFVEPFPSLEDSSMRVNCFNNETIDTRVQAKMVALGVTIYRQCYFDHWITSGNRVETLVLMTPTQLLLVPCFAFFYYGLKAINIKTFKALNECGLVYDDGLVVGPTFESNDPRVFAAGSCTRYSRQLLTSSTHRDYCSEDVGEALANIFLHRLDPFLSGSHYVDFDSTKTPTQHYSTSLLTLRGSRASDHSASQPAYGEASVNPSRGRWQPVMKFESPIVVSATLPGPLYYMTVRKPGLEMPMAVQLLLPHQGHSLTTDKQGNYLHLQLNCLHRVEWMCCLSTKPFAHDTLAQVYRHHEAVFNHLLYRFQNNLIDDLYAYFTQPWVTALGQEPIHKLFYDIYDQGGDELYNFVKSKSTEFYEGNERKTSVGARRCSCGKGIQFPRKEPMDIPSECGQAESLRDAASAYWNSIDGEKIVIKNLTKYLLKNCVSSSHYALPDPKVVFDAP